MFTWSRLGEQDWPAGAAGGERRHDGKNRREGNESDASRKDVQTALEHSRDYSFAVMPA